MDPKRQSKRQTIPTFIAEKILTYMSYNVAAILHGDE